MLEQLYIKNVALIDEMSVEFGNGLNILSGETGAGKSIIIDSINFVLGEKAQKDFIHKGSDKANVEALIYLKNKNVKKELLSMGIEIDEDNSILISRTLNATGKTNCRINGKAITIGMLKEISALLIDIHGQHEHQSLLNPAKHIVLLDKFCSNELDRLKKNLSEIMKDYKEVLKALSEFDTNIGDREARIELYKYQINEIKEAKLKINDEDELGKKRKLLLSAEKITNYTNACLEFLYRSEEMSAVDKIAGALNNLYDISQLDSSQKDNYVRLEEISVQLEELVSDLKSYCDGLEVNASELDAVEQRLDLIYQLKRKYGQSIKEILDYCSEIENKLELLLNSEDKINELNEKKAGYEKEIKVICSEITKLRKSAAESIENEVEAVLKDLGMLNANFKIQVSPKHSFNQNGCDKVEFLISANKGEDLKPLAKIASGGEMSRVMLALKTVLAKEDNIDTFIFDEIDTGVSGRTAQQVAQKLSFIAKEHQILCITHLPQIASMSDNHFLIEKSSDEERTTTSIKKLSNDEIVNELARLIGGAEITETTLAAASDMKKMADELKKKY